MRHATRFGPQWTDDDAAVDAVAKRVEAVGESLHRLSAELKAEHAAVPWALISGMRHRLAHEYPVIDVEILRDVVERHLPGLVTYIERLLEER